MNAAKENILKSLQNNLVQFDEARIHAKLTYDKAVKASADGLKEIYEKELAHIDARQKLVEAEIKSVEAMT